MESFTLANSKFKRNKYDECIKICDILLKENSSDLAVQLLKTQAISKKSYIDDLEIDDVGLGGKLLDEYQINESARPGTSFQRPGSKSGIQAIKPMSSSGRPISGVVRNKTNQKSESRSDILRQNTGSNNRLMTSGGRNIRIATATLQSINSSMTLDVNNINVKNLIKKKALAKVSFNYFLECC